MTPQARRLVSLRARFLLLWAAENLDEAAAAEITATLKACAHRLGRGTAIVSHSNALVKQAAAIKSTESKLQCSGSCAFLSGKRG